MGKTLIGIRTKISLQKKAEKRDANAEQLV
jgi:hypothetical protein